MDDADGHRYFEGLAVAHVLGGLDDSEGQVFRSHLLECRSCRARVGELRAIAHDLADVERDERRVRAAQAIDTKKREDNEDGEETPEQEPSSRASRIAVIVGLVLIIGLSLWNFTLRGALTVQENANRLLVQAGTILQTGEEWDLVRESAGIDGSVVAKDDQFVIAVDGLTAGQMYGLYVQDAAGVVAARYEVPVEEGGRLYRLLKLPADAGRITLTDPADMEGSVGMPGENPDGDRVFEARRP
ncbi:MAG TPA: hypothetical protein VM307_08660 [Egibacteraceae bacterium]|nr:hypothetical protein [Egibacteraceae bacterium]